ncbi:tRNA pseudouridine(55) synthase TruB [Melioribacter sp. OK-6-Me]|uniref:tRNA pseudouridine(55) synthase TruB n=1 Tax=unclassified Melioribacter TaxID=2627329 RepID=UPI003ED90720
MKVITRKMFNDYIPDFLNGEALLIDKPIRKTSFDIVHRVRKAVNIKKVGHAGTLDPLATGLLIICTGRFTKKIPEFSNLNKVYTGIISLGKTTPSYDLETEFDSVKEISDIDETIIYKTAKDFIGKSFQLPPMYSAVKKNGRALYKYARKGIEVERKEREIEVFRFDIKKIDMPDIHFEIEVTPGTYIRVIAHEFGQKIGCGAYLKSLRRTTIGPYSVEDAFGIEEFENFVTNLADNEHI